ncbi:hypothetical protein WJX72_001675 [[Myrmecia] bisecta]|uniref:Threonylcarbamoyl-AMP synthase n=1 Tax=[Myrmecia] bisecta TaxID=41462 RepID=A0AAW1QE82_9CHLO
MHEGQQDQLRAVVHCMPSEANLTITLSLVGKQRNLDRPKSESLEKSLSRIQKSATAKPAKKQKQQLGAAEPAVPAVGLYDAKNGAGPLGGETPNVDAWQPGRILRVGELEYTVVLNPPTVKQIEVYGQAIVGIPLLPNVELLFADQASTQWAWLRKPKAPSFHAASSGGHSPRGHPASPRGAKAIHAEHGWQPSGHSERAYTPTSEDVGYMLRVICTPVAVRPTGYSGANGDTSTTEHGATASLDLGPVMPGPPVRAAADRHALTQQPLAPPGLRLVTYNILADQYASSNFARTHLFAYCPSKFMAPEYRRPLVVQELLGYHADLICLQEVDQKAFAQYFQPQLSYAGYEGYYTNKAGKTMEGSATFYRRERFRLVVQRDLNLRTIFHDLLEGRAATSRHAHFLPMLATSPALAHALQKVSTIAQASILVPRDSTCSADGPICLVNTHLFFHSKAPHIRTMHTAAIIDEAQQLIDQAIGSPQLSQELGGLRPALVFCGDLNSDLNDGIPGAVELLRKGALPADFWDWSYGATFAFNRSTDIDPNAVSDEDEEMPDAPAPTSSAPASAQRMRVARQLGLPDEAELAGWIPSERFPSDHLSVAFDLEWLPRSAPSAAASQHAGASTSGQQAQQAQRASNVLPAASEHVHKAVAALQRDEVIALPSDTLYGLAASARSAAGVQRIFTIKNRPTHAILAICVADREDVARYGETDHLAAGVLVDLLPGPVTVVLRRRPGSPLCAELNPGEATIGIRIPDAGFIREVCREHGGALALTSANISGQASPVNVAEFAPLWDQCAAVFDAGTLQAGREGSTLVDLSVAGQFKMLRRGSAYEQVVPLLTDKYGLRQIQ